ncbi:gamma-glutamylcyclotransferase family protein [Curtobacterium pusillum]|uniref:gamma-glutamylcyclotransferase family protein n=1 Tax=Curtobacterium pusillum TaxID=69373 RepID=UPI0021B53D98|nr:gamma-glutamylcyclotransferase family protein [Curtobacterium pusillum]
MHRLSPGQRWVIGLGAFALTCCVVGIVAVGVSVAHGGTASGAWGGILAVVGLLHLGLTGVAGAIVWTSTPTIAPARPRRPAPTHGDVHRVFSSGTLRQSDVQDALFGRVVRTVEDALPGWRLDWVTITDPAVIRTSGSDRHPILRRGTPEDRVEGAYLVLGYEWQLREVDRYEVADYQRIEVTLESGTTAWVYVAADEV